MDKVTNTLLDAMKKALEKPGEQRLFRSGKLEGLFASRTGANAEAADKALSEGLLEVVRSEPKGNRLMQWVQPTPRAVEFLHAHESPASALKELQEVLRKNHEGLPNWYAELQAELNNQSHKLLSEFQRISHRLDELSRRVDQAMQRADMNNPMRDEFISETIPWSGSALNYLHRRQHSRGLTPCPMSELFLALQNHHSEINLGEFHRGLRRLSERKLIRLLPVENALELAEPEYALLDGINTYYYVTIAA